MSDTHAISLKRSTALLAAVAFIAALTAVNVASIFGSKVGAADLTERSLTLSSTLPGGESGDNVAGSPTNGAAATHTFNFTTTDTSVSSVVLNYCQLAIGTCDAPVGLDLAAADSSDGTVTVGDHGNGTGNQATIALDSAWNAAGAQEVDLTLVTNPTSVGTFFVRIEAGDDSGTVASSITEGIDITARVAETLGFSTTGEFTGVGDPGSSCSALTGSGSITLGDPTENTLDITQTYDNYSAFRLYTNAAGGVEVQYHGDTLTRAAGGDIDAIGAGAAASAVGSEQFGLAIDTVSGGDGAGSTPVNVESLTNPLEFQYVNTSAELSDNGALTPVPAYANGSGSITNAGSAQFAFVAGTPTTIAQTSSLGNGYTECKTVAVRYIANVSPITTSGTYSTTVVYSAVPTY